MPGFFDFTDPGANSPMDNGEQSWGGDMIYGGNQPIAPQANPFDSFMPQMPQGGMSTQVPFDALSAMNGIQMPQLPQQDSMGRYGITDAQRSGAGNQSLAAILMGAGQSMFDDNPNAVLQAASASGGIRRGALDKASQENVNAFKLQVEAKAKELDFISKKSDIARQQMQIEAEQMKLEDLKLKRQVAVQFGKEMAPVAAEVLQKAQNMYPDKVDGIKKMFLAAQAKLAEGDIDGANARYDLAMLELPDEWAKDTHDKVLKATLAAANKWEIGVETAKSPAFLSAVAASGGEIEWGADGMPTVLSKNDVEIRNLRKQQIQESIASEKARQASYANNGGANGGYTQGALANEIQQITAAAQQLLVPVPDVSDGADAYEIRTKRAMAQGMLGVTGMDAQTWLSLTPQQMEQKLMQVRGGAQGGGVAAPPQGVQGPPARQMPTVQGGKSAVNAPSPAVARMRFNAAANLSEGRKEAAIQALVDSGDSAVAKALRAASADPRFAGKKRDVNGLYNYLKDNI